MSLLQLARNKLLELRLRRRLKALKRTLSPRSLAFAESLESRLQSASGADSRLLVLQQTASSLSEQQMRVVERLERIESNLKKE